MGVDVVQIAVFLEQFDGGFLADAAHAGDVVGFIAHQRLEIHNLVGAHAENGKHLFGGVIFAFGKLALGQGNDDAVIHQLEQVAVAGDDFDAHPLLGGGTAGGAAEHVVGLVALHLQPRETERIHNLADALHLGNEVVGHFGTGGFVFGVNFVAESAPRVKRHGEEIGALLLQNAEQDGGEAIHGGGGLAGGRAPAVAAGAARGQSKVSTIRERVSV